MKMIKKKVCSGLMSIIIAAGTVFFPLEEGLVMAAQFDDSDASIEYQEDVTAEEVQKGSLSEEASTDEEVITDDAETVEIFLDDGASAKKNADDLFSDSALTDIRIADSGAIDSGTCGENVTWTLEGSETDEYTLVISGNGAMTDYTYALDAPWLCYDSKIKKVYISYGVTKIGNYAFPCCKNLSEVVMADSVTEIGNSAFDECKSLSDVKLSEGLITIGRGSFWDCCKLTEIDMPDSVREIGDFAFSGCYELNTIKLSQNVKKIGESAFEDCRGLTNIEIPGGVAEIGEYAFSSCSGLTSIKFLGEITDIDDKAFYRCESLTSLIIPVEEVGFNAITGILNAGVNIKDIYYQGTKDEWNEKYSSYETECLEKDGIIIHYESSLPSVSVTPTPTAAPTAAPTLTAAPTPTSVPAVSNPVLEVNVTGTLVLKTKQKLTGLKVTMTQGDSVVSWKSSNEKLVKVTGNSDGTCIITAQKKTGKATITITLASGLKKKITVKVQKAKVTTKKITGVSSKITLKKGKSKKLSVTLNPISSTDKITYKTSNKNVVTVSSKGVIKAKKKGTATITIKAGKKTKKIKVTVK